MRVLQEIGPQEQPQCWGQYLYLRGGQPTGQIEHWHISRLPDARTIVRAEISGQAGDGLDLLAHLVRSPDDQPELLLLRLRYGGLQAAAQYDFEEAGVKVTRQTQGYARREERIDLPAAFQTDFHPVIAHDYVWRGYPAHARGKEWGVPLFTPALFADDPMEVLGGRAVRFMVRPGEAQAITVGAGTFEAARHFSVTLGDGAQALAWFDADGVPLRWYYPDKNYDFTLSAYVRAGS